MPKSRVQSRPDEETEEAEVPRTYRATRVGAVDFGAMEPLLEEFAATGAVDFDGPTLCELTKQRLFSGDPTFFAFLVADDEVPGNAVGVLTAYVNMALTGPEFWVLVAYVRPGEGLGAGAALRKLAFSWAKALGLKRAVCRTLRQEGGQLTEPRGWEHHGFEAESVILVKPI